MRDLTYLTRHYGEKIARIHEIDAPIQFVFITDMHHRLDCTAVDGPDRYEQATDAIHSIQYILDRCPGIQFIINGGDIGNDYDPDPVRKRESFQEVMDALYSLSVPTHSVIGNHDDAIGNALAHGWDTSLHCFSDKDLHKLCMKYNPTEENYYFFDTAQGYRFVLMNTSDMPYYRDEAGQYPFSRLEISNKQAQWLEREALNTNQRILIVSHAPLHNEGIYGTENPDTVDSRPYIKPYDDTLNAPRINYAISQCPNVVAKLAGHVHYDNLLYHDDIATITTQCALRQTWSPACPKRLHGTISDTAFDVISIRDDMMFLTRFGAGHDRVAHLLRARQTQPTI